MNILVKTFHSQVIQLNVEPSDSILSIKQQLQQTLDVSTQKQRLIFNLKELNDEQSASDAGLSADKVIFLVLKLEGIKRVIIRTLDDREFALEAQPENSIFDIKMKVQDKISTPIARQRLIAQGRELLDQEKLADHFSESGNDQFILHLLVRPLIATRKDCPAKSNAEAMEALKEKINERRKALLEGRLTVDGDGSVSSKGRKSLASQQQQQLENMEFDEAFIDIFSKNNEVSDFASLEEFLQRDMMDLSPDESNNLMSALMQSSSGETTPLVKVKQEYQEANFEKEWNSSVVTKSTKGKHHQTNNNNAAVAAAASASAAAAATASAASSACKATPSTRKVKVEMTADERLHKRLLKNRLSAERSRQRKQAYMEELEYKLSLSKSENTLLKDRVRELECSLVALSLMVKPGMMDQSAISSSLQALPIPNTAH